MTGETLSNPLDPQGRILVRLSAFELHNQLFAEATSRDGIFEP